jgi:hypothetical protein
MQQGNRSKPRNDGPRDSLIAWSGGVESTALVVWALEQGWNPLLYHTVNPWDLRTVENELVGINEMKKILNVEVVDVENLCHGPTQYNGRQGKSNLDFYLWMFWGVFFAQLNPGLDVLYYGNNNGIYKPGDGFGDVESWEFERVKQGCIQSASGLKNKFDVQCPLHRPKVELWNMIPDELKPYVWSNDKHEEWIKFYDNYKTNSI